MDAVNAGRLATMLFRDFNEDRFDLSARGVVTDEPAPGVEEVEDMRACGASDRTVRLFSTFIMAMNYQRKAAPLWSRGHALFKVRPELYDPDFISTLSHDSLRQHLSNFKVSQKHERDTRAWSGIAQSLLTGGPVRRLMTTALATLRNCSGTCRAEMRATAGFHT